MTACSPLELMTHIITDMSFCKDYTGFKYSAPIQAPSTAGIKASAQASRVEAANLTSLLEVFRVVWRQRMVRG